MSLRIKFALLLGVVAVAVVTMLGFSLWSIAYMDRQVTGRLHSTDSLLAGLNQLKRRSWEQAELLGQSSFPTQRANKGLSPGSPGEPATKDDFLRLSMDVETDLAALEALDDYYARAGMTRARALREGTRIIRESGALWFESGDPDALARAGDELYFQHERIEATEQAIIGDSRSFVDDGRPLRAGVTIILFGVTTIVMLTVLLGVLLVRRWIFQPVSQLRTAAARVGAGDYDHRISLGGTDEMARLAGEFDEMAGLVKHMQEERVERERLAAVGEMVQRIVHNIRGPLGGIRSLAEIVERSPDRVELTRDSMGRIKSTVDRFEGWVHDLLNATRPVEITTRDVEIPGWLETVVESSRAAAESAGVSLILDASSPATAPIDPQHLEQAMLAIVTNAVQATPRGGTVRVASSNGLPGAWRLEIEDSGPGIDPEHVDRIFRAYFTTKHGGSGIGLAHAKRIVEQHAGRLWAENIEAASDGAAGPMGARFVIELPDNMPPASDQ